MEQPHFDIVSEDDINTLHQVSIRRVKKQNRIKKKAARLAKLAEIPKVYEVEYIHSSLKDLNKHIKPNSIDFIITDPPYPKEYIPVYEELSWFADYALKEGGELFVLTGKLYFPDYLNGLLASPNIHYNWIINSILNKGGKAVVHPAKVFTGWKPIVHLYKGKRDPDRFYKYDLCDNPPKNHNFELHHWQQDTYMFDYILDDYVFSNDVVLDPFAGSGTTAISCINRGVKCILSDIDKKYIDICKKRLDPILKQKINIV